jgi:dephospho-CoA kinase
MIKVGITGGIGSGKTTVCKIFEQLGISTYYADDRAKWLMCNDQILKKGIENLFGQEAFLSDGALNRTHISSIAFQNQAKLSELNALVHPAVQKDGEEWFKNQKSKYAIKEAALLIESKGHLLMDKIIVITAPLELRIERVMARDQVSREAVEARIAKQMSENDKVKLADFIIFNDGKKNLEAQVREIDIFLSE